MTDKAVISTIIEERYSEVLGSSEVAEEIEALLKKSKDGKDSILVALEEEAFTKEFAANVANLVHNHERAESAAEKGAYTFLWRVANDLVQKSEEFYEAYMDEEERLTTIRELGYNPNKLVQTFENGTTFTQTTKNGGEITEDNPVIKKSYNNPEAGLLYEMIYENSSDGDPKFIKLNGEAMPVAGEIFFMALALEHEFINQSAEELKLMGDALKQAQSLLGR